MNEISVTYFCPDLASFITLMDFEGFAGTTALDISLDKTLPLKLFFIL